MEWISGNIFIRENRMAKAGDVIHGHTHNFDHTSIVKRGGVEIRFRLPGTRRYITQRFVAENSLLLPRTPTSHALIRKDVKHKITCLEDDTVFWCVYSNRDPQGEVTQEYTGWLDAYG